MGGALVGLDRSDLASDSSRTLRASSSVSGRTVTSSQMADLAKRYRSLRE